MSSENLNNLSQEELNKILKEEYKKIKISKRENHRNDKGSKTK